MPEVEVTPETAALLVLNGHATVAPDGVLDLTPAGVKWLDDWLERQRAAHEAPRHGAWSGEGENPPW